MSVMYRALWSAGQSTENDVVSAARLAYGAWSGDDQVAADGRRELAGPRHVNTRYSEVSTGPDGVAGFTAVLTDNGTDGSEWITELRVISADNTIHFWVEQTMNSDDLSKRIKVGRPRVVEELVQLGKGARLGTSSVSAGLTSVSGRGATVLEEMILDPERGLPIVAFTTPWADDGWAERLAQRTQRRVEGIAQVVLLDPAGQEWMKGSLPTHGVWGGAVRLYVPGKSADDGWRHRFYTRDYLIDRGDSAVDQIVFTVAQMSTRRRPPSLFSQLLTEPIDADLLGERDRLEFELSDAIEELDRLARELTNARGHLERLQISLAERGLHEIFYGAGVPVEPDDPRDDDITDVSSAVLFAQERFAEWIEIPEGSCRELMVLDATATAVSWGNTTWRGLQALAEYARAREGGFTGGFWEWCGSGSPLAWPATPKKLAMKESDSVMKNPKFRDTRWFPISSAVHPNGRIVMQSHLKIAEGGGNLAPRVYFHDDTGGATGKVHVGLIGPHHLVPNTKA